MKVPLSWLREFVAVELDPAALCERLTMGGLEVDGITQLGAEIKDVIVGELISTAPHPGAERLTICEVRTGAGATVSVVCGATNMKAGDRVAYAPPGSVLPGDRRIEQTPIRGITSAGMLCSEVELGLAASSPGILILGPEAPLGERVAAVLGIEETVLEVSVTPNRGDCVSVLGIAREVAALTGAPLLRTRSALRERGEPAAAAATVRIDDPIGCPRYTARIVRGVTVGPSPAWVQRRLHAVGMRPINNVVDVTNYVMLERGQPLHAFDYDRLPRPEIVVRRAGETRHIRTLDGVDRALVADDLLITTGHEAIAIAGVMGGSETEVTAATTTVLLESACFDPPSIRRTAKRLELRSEASYRFERGVDIAGVAAAAERAAVLLKQWAGGEVGRGSIDVYPRPPAPSPIHLRPKRIEEILGVPFARADVIGALKALGVAVSAAPHGALSANVPSYRNDLKREIDLVEEVARVLGYARIPATMPSVRLAGGDMPERLSWERELKRLLVGYGFYEAITLSFTSRAMNAWFPGIGTDGASITLANPMSRDESELRRSLLGGLLAAWRVNRNHGARGIAAFTTGRVFWRANEPRESWRLAGVMAGEVAHHGLGAPRRAEFADVKGVVDALCERLRIADRVRWERWPHAPFHPGATAALRCGDDLIGVVGGLHPDVAFALDLDVPFWSFELDTQKVLPYCPAHLRFVGLPRFPSVGRDVAIVVDGDFASDRVVQFVRAWQPAQIENVAVEDVALFDSYVGTPIPAGKKSLAYAISYRAGDRTLTDDEVNALHGELVAALTRQFGAELRT
jgi:phenylalanyl-tRNA synthetase beta chain